MITEIILISLWCGIVGLDMQNFLTHLHRPLVSGLVVGLILGDVKTGLIAGGTIELAFLGLVPIAGSQPPHPVIAGVVGSAFAILLHQDPKTAVGIALPFAVLMQILVLFLYTMYSFLAYKADKYAQEVNPSGVSRQVYFGLLGLFILNFVMSFLPLYLGAALAKSLLDKIPDWVIGGLSVAGGLMPAIGFAILLTIMLKRSYIAYLAIGFILAIYLKLPITAIAILGLSFAAIDYFIRKRIATDIAQSGILTNNQSKNEDDEEGI